MVYSYKSLTEDQLILIGKIFLCVYCFDNGYSLFFNMFYKNTFFNESPKCHLYTYIFDNNVLQFYLDHQVNYIYKPYICKMCISVHNLNIETGRFYDLDGHERVCSMCNLNVVRP
jgi:hypothetical protein